VGPHAAAPPTICSAGCTQQGERRSVGLAVAEGGGGWG
jgi:hypothetical protein